MLLLLVSAGFSWNLPQVYLGYPIRGWRWSTVGEKSLDNPFTGLPEVRVFRRNLGITSLVAGTTFCPQGRVTGCAVGWLVGWLVCLFVCLIVCLFVCLFVCCCCYCCCCCCCCRWSWTGGCWRPCCLLKCGTLARSTTHSWWILSKIDWLMISMVVEVWGLMKSMYSLVFDEDLFDIFSPQLSTCGNMIPNLTCAHFVQRCRKKELCLLGKFQVKSNLHFCSIGLFFYKLCFILKSQRRRFETQCPTNPNPLLE